ncbi:hypothetical protein V6Z11_D02G102800 [Gossypium hirsutum]|uniref:Uncharacterized protein n=1 Tax=Gossypium tomentosum TaxID=34277 RepID=A0A5D2LVP3_GOSTO|nr:hypothetical protein ES332_D02G110400v1 [Gossypium tomentosum]
MVRRSLAGGTEMHARAETRHVRGRVSCVWLAAAEAEGCRRLGFQSQLG